MCFRLTGKRCFREEASHLHADGFGVQQGLGLRRREPPLGEHGDLIADLEQFFEFLRDDENGDTGARKVEQRLT